MPLICLSISLPCYHSTSSRSVDFHINLCLLVLIDFDAVVCTSDEWINNLDSFTSFAQRSEHKWNNEITFQIMRWLNKLLVWMAIRLQFTIITYLFSIDLKWWINISIINPIGLSKIDHYIIQRFSFCANRLQEILNWTTNFRWSNQRVTLLYFP